MRNISTGVLAALWAALLGFSGLYLLVGIVFLMLIVRIVNQGPEPA